MLTSEEIAMFRHIPEDDLVQLSAELDIPVPAKIKVDELLETVVVRLAQLARRDGLPLSHYDRDDLENMPSDQIHALASLVGVSPNIDALLRTGQRVYKRYSKNHPRSQIPMLLPMLLSALARHAAATETS